MDLHKGIMMSEMVVGSILPRLRKAPSRWYSLVSHKGSLQKLQDDLWDSSKRQNSEIMELFFNRVVNCKTSWDIGNHAGLKWLISSIVSSQFLWLHMVLCDGDIWYRLSFLKTWKIRIYYTYFSIEDNCFIFFVLVCRIYYTSIFSYWFLKIYQCISFPPKKRNVSKQQ